MKKILLISPIITEHISADMPTRIKDIPFLREKAFIVPLHIATIAALTPDEIEELRRQISLEESVDIEQFIDRTEVKVPEGFNTPYKDIFEEIHKHVHLGLKDKTRTADALIEVFTDFLTRWGRTFSTFSDHHKVYLFELADRTIEKENRTVGTQGSPIPIQADEPVPNIKKTRLAEEILKAVEQELRG